MKKHRLTSPFRWQYQHFNACITIFKYFKQHSSEARQLGTVVIADVEHFWDKRKGHRIPLSTSTFSWLPHHTVQPWKQEGKAKVSPVARSAHRKNLLGSAESNTSETAVLYEVDWKKRGTKCSFKEFCFAPFSLYAEHSSDTARSWAKMFGVAISYSISQLESFYVAILI